MTDSPIPINVAIKATASSAKESEYERGFHNGLVAGRYLTSEPDADVEKLADVKGYVSKSKESEEATKAAEKAASDQEVALQLAADTAREETAKEYEEQIALLTAQVANYRDNSVPMDTHKKMLDDFNATIALKDAQVQEARATASIALRAPIAGDKYRVALDHNPGSKRWMLVTSKGNVVARYATEDEALAARVTTG